jgi:enamine deaminase RidA (YjgF/YER057c/UK114 family)
MSVLVRLKSMGITLPEVAAPVANYVPAVVHDRIVTISGQLPRRNGMVIVGQVGADLDVEEGQEAARLCGIAILATLANTLGGNLDQVERCLQLNGFVNAPVSFTDHPTVINGASDLMVEVFGENGRHARAAVGCSSLPLGAAVEVAATFALKSPR